MRWNTFSRLVLAGREASNTADAIMNYRLGQALEAIIGGRERRARRRAA